MENVKDVKKLIDEMQEEEKVKDKLVLQQIDVQMNTLQARLERK